MAELHAEVLDQSGQRRKLTTKTELTGAVRWYDRDSHRPTSLAGRTWKEAIGAVLRNTRKVFLMCWHRDAGGSNPVAENTRQEGILAAAGQEVERN